MAGLLHYLRALASAGTAAFDADYKQSLKVYESMPKNARKKNPTLGPGQIHDYLAGKTRPAPKIQFLGAFDTVKAVNDRSLYDISFNDSIQHSRQALALNENRKDFSPEYLYPEFSTGRQGNRSFLQAWFFGAHIDIGGSATNDRLSFYPLQWMFLESKAKGLKLGFDGTFNNRVDIDNPLHVVFPDHELQGKCEELWSCKVENGIVVEMQDLRKVHELADYKHRYKVRLNKHRALYFKTRPREPLMQKEN